MNLKTFLQDIKAKFDAPLIPEAPVVPAVAAAPAPEAPAGKTYKLLDGTEISIAQAGEIPAVGDMVMIAGAPAPEGVLTLEDKSTLTVDAAGVITQVSVAPPITQDLTQAPPMPTMEERIAAIEGAIAQLRTPAPSQAMATEDALVTASARISKHEETINALFSLVEKMVDMPMVDPKTLTGAKKDQFDRVNKKEERMQHFADALKKQKANK